jgi:monothiol glutaredoxin
MSIEQFIDSEVKSNDVVLFMKGTPQFPQCGFSGQVVQILDGCDIIREMFQAGELQQLFADKGVTVAAPASA